jgi:hypothetical protein
MASSISIRAKDRLEGSTNFNVWKLRITNILHEHDLEQYVTSVVDQPMNNAGRATFKKSCWQILNKQRMRVDDCCL